METTDSRVEINRQREISKLAAKIRPVLEAQNIYLINLPRDIAKAVIDGNELHGPPET